MLPGIEDRGVAADVARFERLPQAEGRLEVTPRVIEFPTAVLEQHAVVFRTVDRASQQREKIFAAEVLLLAPEVGESVGGSVVEKFALVLARKRHHFVAHLDHDIVIRSVVLGGIEGRTGGKSPRRSLVRITVLLGGQFGEERQTFAGLTHILDDLFVVHHHRSGARRVHRSGFGRIEDNRNAAVDAAVAVIGSDPEHSQSAEEIGDAGSFRLEGGTQLAHRRNDLDEVIGLGVGLVHLFPGGFHVASVARAHLEIADLLGLGLGTAHGHIVAATLEPRDTASGDALRVIRSKGVEGGNGLGDVILRLPCFCLVVLLDIEKIGASQ